jgi:hypothetical protein
MINFFSVQFFKASVQFFKILTTILFSNYPVQLQASFSFQTQPTILKNFC